MDWKLRDKDRIALLAAIADNGEIREPRETLDELVQAYAMALGTLRGKVETALSMLTPLEPEPEPEADSTPELDIF